MYDPLGYRPHSSSDPAYAGPPSPRGKVLGGRILRLAALAQDDMRFLGVRCGGLGAECF